MTLKSGFPFLAAALAAAVLVAFPQPGAAQAYSDSFEEGTINSWWTQAGDPGQLFALSTAQSHSPSQSIVGVSTYTGTYSGFRLRHTFSGPVRGDFSVWVYDDPAANANFWDVYQDMQIFNADSSAGVDVRRTESGYYADNGNAACAYFAPPAASAEWRKMRAIVGDTQVVFEVWNAGGVVGTCTLPLYPSSSVALTRVDLQVSGAISSAATPDTPMYFDDFSFTPAQAAVHTVSLLYDSSKAAKSGSTIPIKLQLLSGGVNVSSPSLVVHAVAAVKVSPTTSSDVQDAGNSNPDYDFRYDATLGGYIFNLKTTGLTTGTYNLIFTVNGLGDPTYFASFQVK